MSLLKPTSFILSVPEQNASLWEFKQSPSITEPSQKKGVAESWLRYFPPNDLKKKSCQRIKPMKLAVWWKRVTPSWIGKLQTIWETSAPNLGATSSCPKFRTEPAKIRFARNWGKSSVSLASFLFLSELVISMSLTNLIADWSRPQPLKRRSIFRPKFG